MKIATWANNKREQVSLVRRPHTCKSLARAQSTSVSCYAFVLDVGSVAWVLCLDICRPDLQTCAVSHPVSYLVIAALEIR